MERIKKGDTVVVISGAQKGTTGEVLRVNAKDNTAVVQGVNVQTKHQKPSMANPQGGIIKKEAPVDLSNLMPVDPTTSKGTRVKATTLKDGKKVRAASKTGEQLDK
jgi:large subunit ribosomal protein L24